MAGKVKILVADDSAFMRQVVTDILQSDQRMEVIGYARDGLEAVAKAITLKPDVITMDVEMPRLDGIKALERIMTECPTRVVMVSSLTQRHARETIKALSLGAVDFVPKPSADTLADRERMRKDLLDKVWWASRSRLRPLGPSIPGTSAKRTPGSNSRAAKAVVVIGSSTGGPAALQAVMRGLPGDLRAGVLLVQHMPAGFTRSLADRLDGLSEMEVSEASGGELIYEGRALMAPGGFHMAIDSDHRVVLNADPPRHGVRPSVDVTMEIAARVFGKYCVGVVLTGMGFDGAKGCSLIKSGNGLVLAEHESSCVVYGMPRAVIEMGHADVICPIEQVAVQIQDAVRTLYKGRCSA